MSASFRVEWSARALLRLENRIAFLAKKNPRAADEAAETIIAAGNSLRDFPNVGRRYRESNFRRELIVPFGQEGYALLYEVIPDRVRIIGVKHQREASY